MEYNIMLDSGSFIASMQPLSIHILRVFSGYLCSMHVTLSDEGRAMATSNMHKNL